MWPGGTPRQGREGRGGRGRWEGKRGFGVLMVLESRSCDLLSVVSGQEVWFEVAMREVGWRSPPGGGCLDEGDGGCD